MSIWSYVYGLIEVDTMARSSEEAMYLAKTVVNHLPKIRGSEKCAKYHFALADGYNQCSNVDEFGEVSNLAIWGNWVGLFESQTEVFITIEGELRDTEFNSALRDVVRMLNRLAKRLYIRECLVRVSSYKNEVIINNPKWIMEMDQGGWVNRLKGNRIDVYHATHDAALAFGRQEVRVRYVPQEVDG